MDREQQRSAIVQGDDEAPPVLTTWPRLYRAVLIYLMLLIACLYLITRAFHY